MFLQAERDEMMQAQDARSIGHSLMQKNSMIGTALCPAKNGSKVRLAAELLKQFGLTADEIVVQTKTIVGK